MKRPRKGEYGYLNAQRKIEILKTAAMFAVSFAVFLIGFYVNGTNKNLFTLIAVLGMLPASKSAVSMIMFLRFPTGGAKACEQTAAHAKGLAVVYDLVITTRDKSYALYSMAYAGRTLCGYTGDPKADPRRMEEHIASILKKNGYQKLSVKIFDDLSSYLNRLDELREKFSASPDRDREKEAEILNLLLAISL